MNKNNSKRHKHHQQEMFYTASRSIFSSSKKLKAVFATSDLSRDFPFHTENFSHSHIQGYFLYSFRHYPSWKAGMAP